MVFKPKNSRFWYIRLYHQGRTLRTFSTRQTNKAIAQKIERSELTKLAQKNYLGEQEEITIKLALEMWISTKNGSTSEHNYKACSKYMSENLNTSRNMSSLCTADIEFIKTKKQTEPNPLARKGQRTSPSTVKHLITNIRSLHTYIRRLSYKTQPIEWPTMTASLSRIKFLTKEQEDALLRELLPTCKQQIQAQQDSFDLVVCLIDFGMRYSELTNLKFNDIDWNQKTLNVFRKKTNNESYLFMTNRVFEIMVRRFNSRTSQYIFTDKTGKEPRKHSTGAIRKAFKRAGLEGFVVHDLRHTHASRLAQSGMPLYEIAKLLGHQNVATTARYTHLQSNVVSQKAAAILNNINQPTDENVILFNK